MSKQHLPKVLFLSSPKPPLDKGRYLCYNQFRGGKFGGSFILIRLLCFVMIESKKLSFKNFL